MSDHNPPGWGTDAPLTVLLGRVPTRYSTVMDWRYDPDGTETVEVEVLNAPSGVPIPDDAPSVFCVEGQRRAVVAKLLVWLQREGL